MALVTDTGLCTDSEVYTFDEQDIAELRVLTSTIEEEKEEENSITIFIQAHGSEVFKSDITFNQLTVNILSFPGKVGTSGIMKMCDEKSIDITAINAVRAIYNSALPPQVSQTQVSQTQVSQTQVSQTQVSVPTSYKILQTTAPILERLYTRCLIRFEKGFQIYYPRYERIFYLEPNPGEKPHLCPEYGITVVSSSNAHDNDYTLLSDSKKRYDLNWSNPNPQITTFDYWLSKCHDYILKDLIIKCIKKCKQISLSLLLDFFKSIGFKTVNIIDPSCRDCVTNKLSKLTNCVRDIIQSKRPKQIEQKYSIVEVLKRKRMQQALDREKSDSDSDSDSFDSDPPPTPIYRKDSDSDSDSDNDSDSDFLEGIAPASDSELSDYQLLYYNTKNDSDSNLGKRKRGGKSTKKSTRKSTKKSTRKSTRKSTKKSTKKSTRKSTKKSTKKSTLSQKK